MLKSFLTAVCVFSLSIRAAAAQDSTTVLLAGTGPTAGLQSVFDGIADGLLSKGVKVKIVSTEPKSRIVVLEEMKASGNSTLLYLTLTQDPSGNTRTKLLVESYVGGKKMWEEEAKSGMIKKTADKNIADIVKGMKEKLDKRIGGTGLPK